ncbi:outer membrane beta-barrel protein [Microbulbifer agarilyticus]
MKINRSKFFGERCVGTEVAGLAALFVCCSSGIVSYQANAVEVGLPGGWELASGLRVESQYDNNVSLTTEDTQGDWITRYSPRMRLSRESDISSFEANFGASHGIYQDDIKPEFTDYTADLAWQWQATSLVGMRASAAYVDVAQSIGAIAGPPDGESPILIEAERVRRPGAELGLIFGRQGAALQARVTYGQQVNKFADPTRDFTDNYAISEVTYDLTEHWAVGTQFIDRDLDYVESLDSVTRDSATKSLMGTVRFRLPKTNLELRAGELRRTFVAQERPNFSGVRWDLTASWSPRSYSTLSFTAGRNTQESEGLADLVSVDSRVLFWSHQWSGRLSSELSYGKSIGEFIGAGRTDEVLRSSMSIRYEPSDWFGLTVGASKLRNTTDQLAIGLENTRYTVGIEAPL